MSGKLTGRERVNRAMEGRDHDRVPHTETLWSDTLERWSTEGGPSNRAEFLDRIEADFHYGRWVVPGPLQDAKVIEEDEQTRTVIDTFGATLKRWKNRSGTPEHIGWECDSPEIWRAKFRPGYEKSPPAFDEPKVLSQNAEGTEKGRWRFVNVLEPFEILRRLLGDEGTMINLVEELEWIQEIAQVTTDATIRNLDLILEAGAVLDGVWVYGDMAYNSGTFCSPAMYRELIWPQHKRLAEWAHQRDLKAIYHTDGDVRAVVSDYIRAGYDALQPLEAKAKMDIRELAPMYGRDISLFGNMDVMIYAFGTPEEIEAEIDSKIAAGKETGRYIFHSDHSIPPQVSWERYQYILDSYNRRATYDPI